MKSKHNSKKSTMMNGENESSVPKSGGGEGKGKWWDRKNVKNFIPWGSHASLVITGTAVLFLYPKSVTEIVERVSQSGERWMNTADDSTKKIVDSRESD
ncbi:hypothetical protein OROGR_010693 [Orobanche gracilis]